MHIVCLPACMHASRWRTRAWRESNACMHAAASSSSSCTMCTYTRSFLSKKVLHFETETVVPSLVKSQMVNRSLVKVKCAQPRQGSLHDMLPIRPACLARLVEFLPVSWFLSASASVSYGWVGLVAGSRRWRCKMQTVIFRGTHEGSSAQRRTVHNQLRVHARTFHTYLKGHTKIRRRGNSIANMTHFTNRANKTWTSAIRTVGADWKHAGNRSTSPL